MEVSDTVAVVTGAGSGIGSALAIGLRQAGARIVICTDLDAASARETAALVGNGGESLTLDVSDEAAIEALTADVMTRHGRIDIFVSNAGYLKPGGLDLTTAEWQRMMDVHVWSHLAAARAVIPSMIDHGGGYLLNTASAAGLLTQINSGPYAVSKHATVALAEWLAITYADDGIRVSVLCPQAVATGILDRAGIANVKRQAAGDGVLEPDSVASACMDAIREERFLVLPHPEVATYFQRKAADYERWLGGMRRFRRRLLEEE